MPARTENRALGVLLDDPRAGRPVHVEHIPARAGREVPWPSWVPAEVAGALVARGIRAPWSHQAQAADPAQAGRHVVVSPAAAPGTPLGESVGTGLIIDHAYGPDASIIWQAVAIAPEPAGTLADAPGSYQFKDRDGRVIYVD